MTLAAETPPRDPDAFKPDRYPLLRFDDAAWAWFAETCEINEIKLDSGKREILEKLYSHLVGVNEWMNLTRITGAQEYLKLHVFDSLTALDFVDEFSNPGDLCVDLGSGGGYPGLPLMTWLPNRRWVLVDSHQKKVNFLKEAIPLTGCPNATAIAFRGKEAAATCPEVAGQAAVVLARAVGRVDELLEEVAPILRMGGFFIVLKGPAYAEEERRAVQDCADSKGFDVMLEHEVQLEPQDPARFIIVLTKVSDPLARRYGRR
jgi:16S rRNA (guanine527-N7)-methyltransferase